MAVEFKFSSEDKDVVATLEKMTRALEKLKDENKKLKEESRAGNAEAAKGFKESADNTNKAGEAMADYLTNMLDVGKAVEFVVKQLEDLHDVQDKAAEASQKAADSQRSFLANLGNVTEKERSEALKEIDRISAATGVSKDRLYSAASTAESARGGASRAAWASALEQAARVAPRSPGEMDATAGGLLDLVGLTGSESGRANTGFMAAMGAQTRIKNLEFINKNLVPAAIGVGQYGGSAQESAAITTTLTQLSKDPTGATSGTAALAMAQQLAEMLPENDRYDYDATGRRKLAAKGTGLTTTLGRIEQLHADPKLREKFLATSSFEKTQRPFVSQMVGDESSLKLLKSNISSFPTDAASLERMGDEYVGGLNATPIQQQANMASKLEQTKEAMRMANLEQGNASILATEVDSILAATQMNYVHRNLTAWDIRNESKGRGKSAFGDTARERAIHHLDVRRKMLVGEHANVGGPFMGFSKETIDKEEHAKYLAEMIEYLRAIENNQKRAAPTNVKQNPDN